MDVVTIHTDPPVCDRGCLEVRYPYPHCRYKAQYLLSTRAFGFTVVTCRSTSGATTNPVVSRTHGHHVAV